MAEAAKTKTPEVAPVPAGRFQAGESTATAITTNAPRRVDEPPADAIAVEPGAAAAQRAVNAVINQEIAQGFRGSDPAKNRTPNSAYTLAGVNRGDVTPETVVFTPTSK